LRKDSCSVGGGNTSRAAWRSQAKVKREGSEIGKGGGWKIEVLKGKIGKREKRELEGRGKGKREK